MNVVLMTRRAAFTLVEMLMALLIVSIILSASLPIISARQKAVAQNYNNNVSFPIGGVIIWTDMDILPDNTWMECNGASIPSGIEYEQARRVFGENLPDLRELKYPLPKNFIGVWGTTDAIPGGWDEATEYAGVFLRGYGSVVSTQSWTDTLEGVTRSSTTTHKSGEIGVLQGDVIRNITGGVHPYCLRLIDPYGAFYSYVVTGYHAEGVTNDQTMRYIQFDASRVVPVDNVNPENRPVNKAVRYIKYTQPEKNYRYIAKVRY